MAFHACLPTWAYKTLCPKILNLIKNMYVKFLYLALKTFSLNTFDLLGIQ